MRHKYAYALNRDDVTADLAPLTFAIRQLACARSFTAPTDEAVRDTVDAILFRRKSLDAARAGLLTRDELVSLLLAHLQTLMGPPGVVAVDDLRDAVRGLVETLLR